MTHRSGPCSIVMLLNRRRPLRWIKTSTFTARRMCRDPHRRGKAERGTCAGLLRCVEWARVALRDARLAGETEATAGAVCAPADGVPSTGLGRGSDWAAEARTAGGGPPTGGSATK